MKDMESTKKNNNDEFLYSIWNFYELNLSPRTRRTYYNVIKGYVKITGKTPLELSQEDVDKYYLNLTEKLSSKKLSYSTALMRISVMKNLCDYIRHRKNQQGMAYINYFEEIVFPDIDKTIQPESLPSETEIDNLLKMTIENNDKLCNLLFTMVIKCGLTTKEITDLTTNMLAYDDNNCFCICFPAKNGVSRIIKLPDDVSILLNRYLTENKITEGPCFYNKRKTQLKIRDAERLLKAYVDKGIENNLIKNSITFQKLRHTAIKYMLTGGARDEDVAQYSGITTKWMPRYRKVVNDALKLNAADYSVISIRNTDNMISS